MKINLINEIKKTILNTNKLKDRYTKIYPNTKYLLDEIIKELVYVLKSGISWNLLRSKINLKTLYWHYTEFIKYSVFDRTLNKMKNMYIKDIVGINNKIDVLIDATTIENKYGINKIGRNKFYRNKKITKVSLMTDSNGFPLSILFMKGNKHDNNTFNNHIEDALIILKNKKIRVIADKGYSSNKNYKLLDKNNMDHIIPPRKNMKQYKLYNYSKKDYVRRIKIENVFGIIKNYKRISIRYDKLLRNFKGFIIIGLLIFAKNVLNKDI